MRSIAAPLLGAGAGGLHSERVVASLSAGFLASADARSSADDPCSAPGCIRTPRGTAPYPPRKDQEASQGLHQYQVIVREEHLAEGLPAYLRTKYAFHAQPSDTSLSFREDLVRELLELPLDERLEATEFAL